MSGDYLGDGLDDIVWLDRDGFILWMHRPSGDAVIRVAYTIMFDSPTVAPAGVAARTSTDAGVPLSVVSGTPIELVGPTRD